MKFLAGWRALPSIAFVVAGVTFLAIAAVEFRKIRVSAEKGTMLHIDNPDRDLGEIRLQSPGVVTFEVQNPTDREFQIVGLRESCGLRCCFLSKQTVPVAISPGQKLQFSCEIEVKTAGPFSAEIVLILREDSMRESILRVNGIGR